jgi:MerR family transcriptional regulator, heat shock protein HspR
MQDKGPLYVISVASRLLALHPQTLRKYERAGFVIPSRTDGNLRLYSPEDLALLRQVKHLVDERGVNLAGVELALKVTHLAERLLDLAEHEGNTAQLRRDVQETATNILRTLGRPNTSNE